MTGTFEGVGSLQFSPDYKYCYAYSGLFSTSTTEFIMLKFTTNSEYIRGEFIMNGATRMDLIDVGAISGFELNMNGEIICQVKVDTNDKDSPAQAFFRVIIPPFTDVELTAVASEDNTNEKMSATFEGSVHGAIEQENLESITNNNKWASL